MDRASATTTVGLGLISDRIENFAFTSFLLDVSNEKGIVQHFYRFWR